MSKRLVVIDAVIEANDGCQTPLVDLMRKTQRASREEAGCLVYRFTRDLDETSLFYVLEVWQSESALLAHLADAPFKLFAGSLPDFGRLLDSHRRIGEMEPYVLPQTTGPVA